ncbi:MAG TPA: LacI family DNA-binding transcriptional regulator, partial [Fimbriimonas sp.]
SHATVSFVLNDRRDVAIPEVTRQRVIATAREMGYRPNRAARALVMGRTQMVAIWQPTPVDPYYGLVFDRLYNHIRERGYETMYCRSGATHDEARAFEWPVDGVIGVDTYANRLEGRDAPQMPYVSLGPYCDRRTDHVKIDLFSGSSQAVTHLADQGCQNVVYLTPEKESNDERGRQAAYLEAVKKARLPQRVVRVEAQTREDVTEAIAAEIKRNGAFDGLFAFNDTLVMAAYGALSSLGLQIPKDVALVGFDDFPAAQYFPSPISTVRLPLEEACARSVEVLDEKIKDPKRDRVVETLPTKLIVRSSSLRK